MKNLATQTILKGPAEKDIDDYASLDVVRVREFHLISIEQPIPLEQKLNTFLKRAFDVAVSLVLIVIFFSWLFPLISILICIDSSGPVFFRQKRTKRNGRFFTCLKFRTMIVNQEADVLPAAQFDTRITRIGAFLRAHHLDELPQLINVLIGDMSMIGPRPYMVSENEKYESLIKNYAIRYKVKPGITGLAQVVDYVNPVLSIENMEGRVKKDVYYVYNWSPLLDAKIFISTFFKMAGIK